MSNFQNENLSPSDAPPLTEEQRTELDDRMARYEQNPENVIAWEQVRARLFQKP
jgi:putative addiction module component (TIGR02574 family)